MTTNARTEKMWGSWNISDGTLNSLLDEEVDCREEVLDKKYLILFEDIKKQKEVHEKCDVLQVVGSELADYLPFDSFVLRRKDTSFISANKERTVYDLGMQLINNIRNNSENVQEVIELLSNTNNVILIKVLSYVWDQVTQDEKKTFIKLISVGALSSHLFCKDILLPKLKEEVSFQSTMEVIYPVSQWLGSQLIVDTFLPLLKDPTSPLVKEEHYLKKCIESFSNSQKSEFLSGYVDTIEGKLQIHDLQVLTTLLENISIYNNSFSKLVDLFSVCITDYNEDRTFGKLLLLIIDNVSADISKSILNDFSLLCNNFKGTMRFRIKAALKKKNYV